MSKNGIQFWQLYSYICIIKLTYKEIEKEIKLSIDFISNLSPYLHIPMVVSTYIQ